ncbi:MAG: hypothetical protein HWQ43_13175 [Nostoc sp. JL31]|uniref:hypothetical protein n=1 Tax=Nostoc sp. JL31 TaxID=2815395 RepID=UPI0025D7FE41|nr:hypothetical protein [Nostoc sp. JL31]MBN3890074.1 hypothetical protein [Nostoc sp. JL31]
MPRKIAHPTPQNQPHQCIQYLHCCGGSARLCRINFSLLVIQTLVNRKLVKVTNTGAGFFVELDEPNENPESNSTIIHAFKQ